MPAQTNPTIPTLTAIELAGLTQQIRESLRGQEAIEIWEDYVAIALTAKYGVEGALLICRANFDDPHAPRDLDLNPGRTNWRGIVCGIAEMVWELHEGRDHHDGSFKDKVHDWESCWHRDFERVWAWAKWVLQGLDWDAAENASALEEGC